MADLQERLLLLLQTKEDQAWATLRELQEKAGMFSPTRLAERKAAILDHLCELRRKRMAIEETIDERKRQDARPEQAR